MPIRDTRRTLERSATTFIMADILNILLCVSKLVFLVSLRKEDSFELQTHERAENGL